MSISSFVSRESATSLEKSKDRFALASAAGVSAWETGVSLHPPDIGKMVKNMGIRCDAITFGATSQKIRAN
jgi:hypothetical protein